MESKYGVLEGRFYIDGAEIMAHIEYRDRKTGELVSRTINTAEVRDGLSLDINNFIVGVIEEVENSNLKEDRDKELTEWLQSKGLYWTEHLPMSGLPGWTDGKFCVIESNKEDFEAIIKRYEFVYRNYEV